MSPGFGLTGKLNFIFLAGIIGAVLLRGVLDGFFKDVVPTAIMTTMGLLSWTLTPRSLREANSFTWGPIIEVAVLFIGIFVTMVPALAILAVCGPRLGLSEAWQYFWLTGSLSAVLDNAPTYMTLATVAAGSHPIDWLATERTQILQAIACGAVFIGALTYIGNGPNFMVKAIADAAGYRMPSFFVYMGYSCLVLIPVFVIVSWMFFGC